MAETTIFSGAPYAGFGSGPFQASANLFAEANGFHTKVGANTSTNVVEGLVATSLANGYASGYLPGGTGSPPSANVYADASVSGFGNTDYGFSVNYGGGIDGIIAHDAAAQYQALQNFSSYSMSGGAGFDIYG